MSLDLAAGIYHGVLVDVVEVEGTGLVGDHAAGVTLLTVASGGFREAGQCRVAGNVYTYTRGGTGLTLTISPGLVALAEDGTPVESLTPDGKVESQTVAVVDLDMLGEDESADDLPRAWIPGELAGFYPLDNPPIGAMLSLEDTTYGYRLVGRPTDKGQLDGSVIDPTTVTVTGGTMQTATSGSRWKMTGASASELLGYTGGASESQPGSLQMAAVGSDYILTILSPQHSSSPTSATVRMFTNASGSEIELSADTVRLSGNAIWNSGGAWTAYTPTFTAVTTNPTLANFTLTGRYAQWGKTVSFTVVITCNAASGFGTGTYEFGLPVAARSINGVVVTGNQSGPNRTYVGRGETLSTFRFYQTSDFTAVNSVNSAMASGAVIRIAGTYEAA